LRLATAALVRLVCGVAAGGGGGAGRGATAGMAHAQSSPAAPVCSSSSLHPMSRRRCAASGPGRRLSELNNAPSAHPAGLGACAATSAGDGKTQAHGTLRCLLAQLTTHAQLTSAVALPVYLTKLHTLHLAIATVVAALGVLAHI